MPKLSLSRVLILSAFTLAVVIPGVLLLLGAMSTDSALSRMDFSQASLEVLFTNINSVLWGSSHFAQALSHTVVLCLAMVLIQVPSSVLSAFAFAFLSFTGKKLLYVTMIGSYLIPAITTVVPLFFLMTALGFKGTPLGILLPYILFSPYALVLLRERCEAIPRELIDQARVDGLGPWGMLWFIVVPLTRPFIVLISLVTFVAMWNAFLWPRLIAGAAWPTVTVAISSLQGQFDSNWHLVLAAAVVAIIPAVSAFILVRNNLVTTAVEEIDI